MNKIKQKFYTKGIKKHLAKLGLPYSDLNIDKEAELLLEHIYEEKINLNYNDTPDVSFVEIKDQKDLHIARDLADIGTKVVVRIKGFNAELLEIQDKFEAIIIEPDDIESLNAGYTNLLVAFDRMPNKIELGVLMAYDNVQIYNQELGNVKRPNARGYSPSTGVILDTYGIANISSVDMLKFVNSGIVTEEDGSETGVNILDYQGLAKAQVLSVRANMRTLTSGKHTKTTLRDTVLASSLENWEEAIDLLGYDDDQEDSLMNTLQQFAHEEALGYASALRINVPMSVTTMAGGVTSLDRYLRFQKFYSDQGTVLELERNEEASDILIKNWDDIVHIKFKVAE